MNPTQLFNENERVVREVKQLMRKYGNFELLALLEKEAETELYSFWLDGHIILIQSEVEKIDRALRNIRKKPRLKYELEQAADEVIMANEILRAKVRRLNIDINDFAIQSLKFTKVFFETPAAYWVKRNRKAEQWLAGEMTVSNGKVKWLARTIEVIELETQGEKYQS